MEKELILLALAIAGFIAAAKVAGMLSARLKQPLVFGELLAGLLLGPTLFDVLNLPLFGKYSQEVAAFINALAFVGVLLLMFLAGLEVRMEDMRQSGQVAILSGVLGSLLPIGATVAVFSYGFDYPLKQSLFLGLVMGATSVSISAQTLMELGVLRSPVGFGLLGAAVVDDVLVILFLSLFVAFAGVGAEAPTVLSVLAVIGRMAAFFVGAWFLGRLLFPTLVGWFKRSGALVQPVISAGLILMMLYAWAAEYIGHVAAITGAFLAGLLFVRHNPQDREAMEEGVQIMAYSMFVPLFFINIGLKTDLQVILKYPQALTEALVLVLLAVATKVLGSGLGARWGGLSWKDAWRLGVGMTSRGEVGLIVASVGISMQVLPEQALAAVVLMVVVTTLLTPMVLQWMYRDELEA